MARYLLVPGACHGGCLLYLDAFVPDDGDSCWSMNNDEQRDWYSRGSGATGLADEPLPFFDRRARPHPLGTPMQRSKLTGAYLVTIMLGLAG
jgi:hypothetical protein